MQLLILDARDNIAIATKDLRAGDIVTADGTELRVRADVPRGHKVAITRLPSGGDVLRYGEVIGAATAMVEPGDHVHVHNLVGKRAQGGTA